MKPEVRYRKRIARLRPAMRAHVQRLVEFRDSYSGKSQIEQRDRAKLVYNYLVRVL